MKRDLLGKRRIWLLALLGALLVLAPGTSGLFTGAMAGSADGKGYRFETRDGKRRLVVREDSKPL
jgi:hypothetical protein